MKELRKDLERAISILNESFLPENQQCDGGCCMGCWKDKVREAIKIIESLSSQSIEEEGKDEEHICKYCGVRTSQPDDQCWNKPKDLN